MNNKPKMPKPDGETVRRLFSYITQDHKGRFAFVIFSVLVSSLASVALSLFIQVLIDNFITPLMKIANPDFSGLARAIMIMGAIALSGVFFTWVYSRIMATIAQRVQKKIRDDMFSHMQTLPIRYFDSHTFGETMSHYTNDIDTLRQVLSQTIPQLLASATNVVLVFIAMIFTNRILTIFMIIGMFLMLQITKFITSNSSAYFGKQQQALGTINGYIEELIHGQKVVKVFCHEKQTKADFDKLNADLKSNATKANSFANILMPIMMNFGNLLYICVAIIGGVMSISGLGVSIGHIATFLQLTKGFTNPISQMSQQINMIIMAVAGAKRIFTFMDEPSETDHGYVTLVNAEINGEEITETDHYTGTWAWKHPHSDGTTTYSKLNGDVRFYDVDFSYVNDKLVLKGVTLHAESGEKIAFVGSTGAGKTTITNLINRFYDIADGKIRYDHININKIKKSDLRRSLGIVLQETNLFTGTIAENIKYGNLYADRDAIVDAAKLANAHGFISRLPKGYDTEISGNSDSLSQGQRQLLSIARAAIANPPVMILDEATSSIDTHTETLVQKGMDGLMKGRTVFVIAHRLSTVRNADAILVLDHGEIIERGNHDKLIAKKGRYYQLYTGAFELD